VASGKSWSELRSVPAQAILNRREAEQEWDDSAPGDAWFQWRRRRGFLTASVVREELWLSRPEAGCLPEAATRGDSSESVDDSDLFLF